MTGIVETLRRDGQWDAADEIELLRKQRDELLAALKLAVKQNSHDMLMTGEESRQCEKAIASVEGEGK